MKRSKLKQSRTRKATKSRIDSRQCPRRTIHDPRPKKARFDDEVSHSETVRFKTPTHSGRSAATNFNEFKYYCFYPWEVLSKILSPYKVSLVLAYVSCLHKFH